MNFVPLSKETINWCSYLLEKKDPNIHIVIGEYIKQDTGEIYQEIIQYSFKFTDKLFVYQLPKNQIKSQCVFNEFEKYLNELNSR